MRSTGSNRTAYLRISDLEVAVVLSDSFFERRESSQIPVVLTRKTRPLKPHLSDGDEIPPEIDEKAQPDGEDGVMEAMAPLRLRLHAAAIGRGAGPTDLN